MVQIVQLLVVQHSVQWVQMQICTHTLISDEAFPEQNKAESQPESET